MDYHSWLKRISIAFCFAFWAAAPLSAASITAGEKVSFAGLIQKVHGFHCREELGWEPRSGLYRRHSHKGICDDYKRCLQVHHRCIFLNGRGVEGWKYERWGWDNWRYTSCMLDRGCY